MLYQFIVSEGRKVHHTSGSNKNSSSSSSRNSSSNYWSLSSYDYSILVERLTSEKWVTSLVKQIKIVNLGKGVSLVVIFCGRVGRQRRRLVVYDERSCGNVSFKDFGVL